MQGLGEVARIDGNAAASAATSFSPKAASDAIRHARFDTHEIHRGATKAACAVVERHNGAGSLSKLHREAIDRLVGAILGGIFEAPAADQPRRIVAIPAPTGTGKSVVTAVVAAALAISFNQHRRRVVVLATQIRDVCDLYEATARMLTGCELDQQLTPAVRQHENMRHVHLLHSEQDASPLFRSCSEADLKQCTILFATQQKARGSHGKRLLGDFDAFVLDEDLGMWATNVETVREIRFAAGVLKLAIEMNILEHGHADLECVSRYVQSCCEAVEQAVNECGLQVCLPVSGLFVTESGRTPVDDVMQALKPKLRREVARIAPVIGQLVDWSGSTVDVHSASGYSGAEEMVLSFRATLPPYMRSIVQLDAQSGFDVFKHLSPDITPDQWFVDRYDELKRYEGSVIHWASIPSGRDTIAEQLATLPKRSEALRTWIDVIKNHVAADEAILTALPRNRIHRKRGGGSRIDPDLYVANARRYLAANGIDPDETLADGRPRFPIARWGQLKASNSWNHCAHFYTLSTPRRKPEDLLGQAIAATGDATTHHPQIDLRTVIANELSRDLVQAANRTRARRIQNGVAEPMKLWLVMANEGGLAKHVLDELIDQMPGISVEQWPQRSDAPTESLVHSIARAITEVLRAHAADSINTTRLRQMVGEQLGREISSAQMAKANYTFPWALDGWRRSGRTLFRSIPEQDAA